MKTKWLAAWGLVGVMAVGVMAVGADPVPAPMPKKAGGHEATGSDGGRQAPKPREKKKAGEAVADPYAAVASAGDEAGDGGGAAQVSEGSSGEAGDLELVPGYTPRTDRPAADKELTPAERQDATAREAEFVALPSAERVEFGAISAEDVCGADGRTQVTATTAVPWRQNCQLIITFRNGSKARGTGWFIGPCTVMTAGHCVYSHATGGWARSIEVIPGKNGAAQPYGSLTSSNLRSVTGWTSGPNQDFDYGAIILPNSTLGNRVGWFGFANLPDAELTGLLANTAGYPGDKPFGTQWFMSDRIARVTPRKIYYMIDTFGGQSGSAVWRLRSGQRHAVGIHAYGGCPNSATRINGDVFANMLAWKNLCN